MVVDATAAGAAALLDAPPRLKPPALGKPVVELVTGTDAAAERMPVIPLPAALSAVVAPLVELADPSFPNKLTR